MLLRELALALIGGGKGCRRNSKMWHSKCVELGVPLDIKGEGQLCWVDEKKWHGICEKCGRSCDYHRFYKNLLCKCGDGYMKLEMLKPKGGVGVAQEPQRGIVLSHRDVVNLSNEEVLVGGVDSECGSCE